MTVEECYREILGDYDKIVKTLRSDALIKKFMIKFLDDTSFSCLSQALKADNTQEAFCEAHNLKGVSGSLAFSKLYESACEITELLRGNDLEGAKRYFPVVEHSYEITINAIKQM